MNTAPQPPGLKLSLTDFPRASAETAKLALNFKRTIKQSKKSIDGAPVVTLPGYGGGDGSMMGIRYFLDRLGYKTYKLSLGRNLEAPEDRIKSVDDATAFREKMMPLVVERLQEIYEEAEQPVTLIGWSMGGLYALDASQEKPEMTKQVITLGSPYGDPRGTSTWSLLRKINRSDVPVETQNFAGWLDKLKLRDTNVPVKILYSEKDGIVAPEVAKINGFDNVEHIEIDSSHIGFAYNHLVYKKLADII